MLTRTRHFHPANHRQHPLSCKDLTAPAASFTGRFATTNAALGDTAAPPPKAKGEKRSTGPLLQSAVGVGLIHLKTNKNLQQFWFDTPIWKIQTKTTCLVEVCFVYCQVQMVLNGRRLNYRCSFVQLKHANRKFRSEHGADVFLAKGLSITVYYHVL